MLINRNDKTKPTGECMKGSRVLITGHTGFKGSWLAQLLNSKDVEIFGLSLYPIENSLYTKLDNSIYAREYFQDINNYTELRAVVRDINPSYVFHLAAQPLVLRSYEDPLQTFATNVMGTANLIESTYNLDAIKSIVVATTDKVYKNFEDGRKYSEEDPLQGIDPYSASKVGCEAVVKAWQTIISGNMNVSLSSARAGNVIGGGDFADQRLLPDLIRSYISQNSINIRSPESTRPWQHVLDPIVGYVKLAELGSKVQDLSSFNFGPEGVSLSVRHLCEIAKQELNLKIDFEIEEDNTRYEAKRLDLDSSKAREMLNWKNRWTQTEAVTSTINWWKSVLSNELSATEACSRDLDLLTDFT